MMSMNSESLDASVGSQKLKDSPGHRSPAGRSFHSRGQAAEKLLSPSLLRFCGTSSFHVNGVGRWSMSEKRRQSSTRYMGAAPTMHVRGQVKRQE